MFCMFLISQLLKRILILVCYLDMRTENSNGHHGHHLNRKYVFFTNFFLPLLPGILPSHNFRTFSVVQKTV